MNSKSIWKWIITGIAGIFLLLVVVGIVRYQAKEAAIEASLEIEAAKASQAARVEKKVALLKELQELKDSYAKLQAKLTMANQRLDEINQFQIGRSRATKEEQLAEQYRYISELQALVIKTENEIQVVESELKNY